MSRPSASPHAHRPAPTTKPSRRKQAKVPPAPSAQAVAAPLLREAEAAFVEGQYEVVINTCGRVLDLLGVSYISANVLNGYGRRCRRAARAMLLGAQLHMAQDTSHVELVPQATEKPSSEEAKQTPVVLLLGGIGRMEPQYRRLVEGFGFSLLYRERGSAWTTPPKNLARIVVFTTVVSHPQREAAERLSTQTGAPVVYLRTASLSALDQALKEAKEALDGV